MATKLCARAWLLAFGFGAWKAHLAEQFSTRRRFNKMRENPKIREKNSLYNVQAPEQVTQRGVVHVWS